MSRKSYLFLGGVVCLLLVVWAARRERRAPLTAVAPPTAVAPTAGTSQALAADRAQRIHSLWYKLALNVPLRKEEPIQGRNEIRFELTDPSRPLQLDFAQPAERISSITANGRPVPVESTNGHLTIPASSLLLGENGLTVEFTAGDLPLNRNDDYLYSLFVPARASLAFPCFDQPDLKASLALTLEVPSGWVAVSNGAEIHRETAGDRTTLRFVPTPALPTYVFGFAAGKFSVEQDNSHGRPFRMYHRETDAAKVARNREAIFSLHAKALSWLETYTARTYPFEKMDFVLIPSFQFAGMEHAGAIFYNAASLLLEETATQEQELARASTISHETSHMWFGDLVTMKWFDDVWLKEVFANFMAAKIVNPSFPNVDHNLRFLLQHYPSAYKVDRTPGTNPIRQKLDNLNEAGSLYGTIIYNKAPIIMRQLEAILGADSLRDGLREYLSRYQFGNATWTDLIQILDARTDEDLAAWSHAWVDEPGRPTIDTQLSVDGGRIVSLAFSQSDPRSRSLIWNQRLQVSMGYADGPRTMPLKMNAPRVEMTDARGIPQPSYILPNGEGVGYGLFRLDAASKSFLLEHLPEVNDAVTRGAAWITLWDDMLEGATPPKQMIELALRALPTEGEEQNVQSMLSSLGEAFWIFESDADRAAVAPRVERVLRAGLAAAAGRSLKAAYFNAFRGIVSTQEGLAYLERIWRRQEQIPGLTLAEVDYIAMAQTLALRNVAATNGILAEQLEHIINPDRKARFTFVLPALSPDEPTRDAFFASLAKVENRRHEPWVIDALAYLNHPLRARHAQIYIRPSLELLQEVQRTGDIFFPSRWMGAVLDGHNSSEAAQAVTAFLAEQKDYPPRLRQIVDQSADTLMRASRILSGRGGR